MNTIEKMDRIMEESIELFQQLINLWSTEMVFTWRWWFGVTVSILTWLIWFKFHKRESRYRLLTAGFFVMLISVCLDAIGIQIGLWSYRYEVIPYIPAYLPYDLALMPVVVMGLIQFKPNFSPLIKAIIYGILTSYIGETLVVFIDIYNPRNWKHIYSLPIYIVIYLIANWLITRKGYEEL